MPAIGEISNLYFFHPRVPERIYSSIPDVKLISVLRNPYERMISAFRFRKRTGQIPSEMDLATALVHYSDLLSDNYYADHLLRYFHYFPRKQCLILFYDDLRKNQQKFFDSIYSFLNISSIPISVNKEPVNPSGIIRWELLAKFVRTSADFLRKRELFAILDILKRSRNLQKFLYRQHTVQEVSLDPMLLHQIAPSLDGAVGQLEQLLGKKLTHWKSDQISSPGKDQ
ncbi:MAG: sulfotransferase domain-containing protein [FCB group bacterium]|nr:sulfotransferase domain-containing protein [FCB group bacterium]